MPATEDLDIGKWGMIEFRSEDDFFVHLFRVKYLLFTYFLSQKCMSVSLGTQTYRAEKNQENAPQQGHPACEYCLYGAPNPESASKGSSPLPVDDS